MRKKSLAMVHGSGVHVSKRQFPEIYECVEIFRQRIKFDGDILIYIVESSTANAATVRYGKKHIIFLTDDLIHSCLASNNPNALSFVIGHELGHVVLKHNGVLRSWMSRHYTRLGRLDEYSADAVATALVGDKTTAFTGLLLLTVGSELLPYVNLESIEIQAKEVTQNKYSKRAEKSLSHPLLFNRLSRILKLS